MRLAAIGLLALLALGAAPRGDVKLGEVVPDIAFKAYDGKEYKLTDFRADPEKKTEGQVVVVYFQSENCPAAISTSQVMKIAAPWLHPKSGVKFIAIYAYPHDTEKGIEKFIAKRKLPYTCAWDADKKVRNLFGAKKVNTTYVLDKTGKLVYRGGLDVKEGKLRAVDQAVKSAKDGSEPPKSDGDFAG